MCTGNVEALETINQDEFLNTAAFLRKHSSEKACYHAVERLHVCRSDRYLKCGDVVVDVI